MIASGRAHALHPAVLRLACPSMVRLPRHALSRIVCSAAAETKQRVVPQTNDLLSPYQMKNLMLDHRIVYAPLTRCRAIGTLLGCGCRGTPCLYCNYLHACRSAVSQTICRLQSFLVSSFEFVLKT